jgi:hypothetical protein
MGWQDAPAVDAGAPKAPAWASAPPVGGPDSTPPLEPPPRAAAPEKKGSILDTVIGLHEVPISLASSIVGAGAGNVVGAGAAATSGKFGTAAGIEEGRKAGEKASEALTYRPRTDFAQNVLGGLSDFLGESKIAGLAPHQAVAAAAPAAARIPKAAPAASAPAAAMPGMGAAETAQAAQRVERAASLPVPVKLTKGQATRDFGDLRFERETAKAGDVGKPLRERYAEQNESILRNFDSFLEQTGAEAPTLRATGQSVDRALVKKAEQAKAQYDAAYTAAREAGELQQPVATKGLADYLAGKQPESINAPVISSAAAKLEQLAPKGAITVNDLEEIRKMVGQLGQKDPTNGHYAREIKGVIDDMTKDAGGDLYQRARKMRFDYAREFEDHAVVSKLLRTKPGTKDRAVAFEDVFAHSVLNGSTDDVRLLRRTLQTAGDEGAQAWKELQGASLNYLRDSATKSVALDIKGNPIVSADGLVKAVRDLDSGGKLDLIFGKKGAEQIRDVAALSQDIHTVPPGAVNTSGTASVLLEALSTAAVGQLPTAAAKTLGAAQKWYANRKVRKQVDESLAGLPVVP